MKKLLGCLALAAALVPSAALAGEDSRIRPGVYADTYCEARWRGVSYEQAMTLAVDAAIVWGEEPTYLNSYNSNGKRHERGIVLGAQWSQELCPKVWAK